MSQLINASVLVPFLVVFLLPMIGTKPAPRSPSSKTSTQATGVLKFLPLLWVLGVLALGFSVSQVRWAEWLVGVSVFGQLAGILEIALDPLSLPTGKRS